MQNYISQVDRNKYLTLVRNKLGTDEYKTEHIRSDRCKTI